jgi:hypothetical protein
MAHLAQDAGNCLARQALAEQLEQLLEHRSVRLGEMSFGRWRQLVRESRLAATPAGCALRHEPIALQRGEVAANRVVGEAKLPGQFVHGPATAPEQEDDLASGAREESFVQWNHSHTGLLSLVPTVVFTTFNVK